MKSVQEKIRSAKHDFMAYRNGIVADTLRSVGVPHKVIFGLQLPQITAIASRLKSEVDEDEAEILADAFWEDSEVRESRLLATRMYPANRLTEEKALEMCRSIRSAEEADILAFALLRHSGKLDDIAAALGEPSDALQRAMKAAVERFR